MFTIVDAAVGVGAAWRTQHPPTVLDAIRAMKKETSTGELGKSPIHLLHRAGQCAGDLFAGKVPERDLTPRQFAVLLTVAQNEGLSQTGLVEKTGIDRSTLADIVRRMLKKGLLQRRRGSKWDYLN